MFDWVKIVLMFLELVKWGIGKAEANQQWNAGAQDEAFKSTKAVMAKTEQGKKILEHIDAMSDAERDNLDDALGDAASAGG